MVVRRIDQGLHDKLWLALGGDDLRLIVNHIMRVNNPIQDTICSNLHWASHIKIQKDILEERSKDYEKN